MSFKTIKVLISIFCIIPIYAKLDKIKHGIIFTKVGNLIKHTNSLHFLIPIHLDHYEMLLSKLDESAILGFDKLVKFIPEQKNIYTNTIGNETSIYRLRDYSELAMYLFSESYRTENPNKAFSNQQIITRLAEIIRDRIDSEKSKVTELFSTTKSKFHKIKHLFDAKNHHTRGLINLGGEISKVLFGTATESDINKLNAKIQKNAKSNEKLLKINNKVISILSLQNFAIGNLSEHVHMIDKSLLILTDDLSVIQQKLRLESFLVVKNLIFESIDRFSSNMKNALILFQIRINSLSESVFATISNKISPNLLDPIELRHTLVEASKAIPQNLYPIPLAYENSIFKAYNLISTDFVKINDSFSIIINIPLINTDQQFEVSTVQTLPIPLSRFSNVTSELKFPKNKYFITTFDKQQMTTTNKENLDDCNKFDKYFLCNSNIKFDKNNKNLKCLQQILNDEEIFDCEKEISISNNTNKFIYLENNTWAFYLPQPELVKIECHIQNTGPDSNAIIKYLKLGRIGHFQLQPNCGMDGKQFSIPKSFEIESKVQILNIQETFRDITDEIEIFNSASWESIDISNFKRQPQNLETLEMELTKLSQNTEHDTTQEQVFKLLEQVKSLQKEASSFELEEPILSNNTITNITFGLIICIILIWLIIMTYKLYIARSVLSFLVFKYSNLENKKGKNKTPQIFIKDPLIRNNTTIV